MARSSAPLNGLEAACDAAAARVGPAHLPTLLGTHYHTPAPPPAAPPAAWAGFNSRAASADARRPPAGSDAGVARAGTEAACVAGGGACGAADGVGASAAAGPAPPGGASPFAAVLAPLSAPDDAGSAPRLPLALTRGRSAEEGALPPVARLRSIASAGGLARCGHCSLDGSVGLPVRDAPHKLRQPQPVLPVLFCLPCALPLPVTCPISGFAFPAPLPMNLSLFPTTSLPKCGYVRLQCWEACNGVLASRRQAINC